jgi:hypothetical protein
MNKGRICFLTSWAAILRRSQFSAGRTMKRQASHMSTGPRYFNIYSLKVLRPISPIFHREMHTQQKNGAKITQIKMQIASIYRHILVVFGTVRYKRGCCHIRGTTRFHCITGLEWGGKELKTIEPSQSVAQFQPRIFWTMEPCASVMAGHITHLKLVRLQSQLIFLNVSSKTSCTPLF